MKKNQTVDDFLAKHRRWHGILLPMRNIMLSCGLEETVKWGSPVYCLDGKNVAGLGAFKSYAGIWFFNGSFLKDRHKKLVNAQEGTTRGMRQWRFASLDELDEALVESYVREAIRNQKAGKEIKPRQNRPVTIPQILKKALAEQQALKTSFLQLSPACQREYAEYIQEAKQEATKVRRLDKIIPMILANKGLNDKYKGKAVD